MSCATQSTPAASDGPHRAPHLKNPDGTWKYTNALAKETSPYLLQHAHNPVDWRPWGKEAFDEARKRGVPIFLSVGYSTCYWCHVMERQCFENEAIARQMNSQFVCIKVDREERPDVDDIYMTATQVMTGSGGWPMSVFLTPPGADGEDDPGLKPFFAGTYFPPTSQRGRPGFPQVMNDITSVWNDRKADVIARASATAEHITRIMTDRPLGGQLSAQTIDRTAAYLLRIYDPVDGGYGEAPKFPQPSNLLLLMAMHRTSTDDTDTGADDTTTSDKIWKSVAHTLERMARGGMYDQIGGGFHRYSTDTRWLVPHFEKMLYDNGQLVEAYLEAHAIQPDPHDPDLYARVVRETCDYVLREMTDETGCFFSAQDAEVDAREGKNYIWLPDQIKDAIDDESLASLALEMYGLDKGTNFQDPHHPDEPRANVISLPERLDVLAKKHGITIDAMAAKRRQINDLLSPVRMQRPQPTTDDKVLVAWNGMMIAALARAGHDLNEPRYTDAAATAARFILDHMRDDAGGLMRSMRQGKVGGIDGFLEDYAFFVHALIALHRATGHDDWLQAATHLTGVARDRFADRRGGSFDTLADQPDLFVRTRNAYDGAISSGNSQMIHNLLDLEALTKDKAFLDQAITDLRSFAGMLQDRGVAMVHMQHALKRAIDAAPQQTTQASPRASPIAAFPEGVPGAADALAAGANKGAMKVAIKADPAEVKREAEATTLRLTLTIADGHHINGPQADEDGLVPTGVRLEQAQGYDIKVAYPEPLLKQYAFSDQPLAVYEGEVTIDVTITKTSAADATARPVLVVTYQACTDMACLKPQDVNAPVVFE